jgi:hypothetical protein
MMGYRWVTKAAALAAVGVWSAQGVASFQSFEKDKILAYWKDPSRYSTSVPNLKGGPWQVRMTPEGSLWLWALNQKRGLGKTFSKPIPRNDEERKWENWIDAKFTYDRWLAGLSANIANAAMGISSNGIGAEPALPGPIPESLWMLVGDAPNFAIAVQPVQHTIVFHDGQKINYTDNTVVPDRYAYYRFAEGVQSGGTQVKKMNDGELSALFKEAGIPADAQKVMKAVSMLEGGFDSVNTYDTGYVSVGFIQFACASRGAGSLGTVLLREKAANPSAFENDFRQFGVDVGPDGALNVLGLTDGQEYLGYDAAKQIILDKRLIAVFQRAGQLSKAFRIAQLQVAKEQYYPADEVVSVKLGGQPVSLKVRDIVHSEAGMATLMDRKVNTGNIALLTSKTQAVADAYGVRSVDELANYEREIVEGMRFRKSYLGDDSLSQPAAKVNAKGRSVSNDTSRHSTRKGRGKGT